MASSSDNFVGFRPWNEPLGLHQKFVNKSETDLHSLKLMFEPKNDGFPSPESPRFQGYIFRCQPLVSGRVPWNPLRIPKLRVAVFLYFFVVKKKLQGHDTNMYQIHAFKRIQYKFKLTIPKYQGKIIMDHEMSWKFTLEYLTTLCLSSRLLVVTVLFGPKKSTFPPLVSLTEVDTANQLP